MATKNSNANLSGARLAKGDEFYTQLSDIERELKHYRKHFEGKVVYLNCDDPRVSNFFHYFSFNFEKLGLKKVIATCYKSQNADLFSQNDSEQAIYLEYEGDLNSNDVPDPEEIGIKPLMGDGDFRNAESIELLKQADIVVTNPPFSLFREYVAQLIKYDKKFVIIGNKNAVSYKEIFPLIQRNKMWVGYTPMGKETLFGIPPALGQELVAGKRDRSYTVVDGVVMGRTQSCWFTNLDISKRHEDLILYKTYSSDNYPRYDNFDAIEVSRTVDIPMDYDGVMGVPLTFLDKHNPDQFEIVGITQSWDGQASRIYPRQVQVSTNGVESTVTKLNDGAAIKVEKAPPGKTYYKVGDESFVKAYARILIRARGAVS
jgi:hypothetical protein